MIIMLTGKPVGVLHSDGSIESQAPYLQGLNEHWQKEGIFTMCPAKSKKGVTIDGAKVVKPSEDIELVIGELMDRGYEVVGRQ